MFSNNMSMPTGSRSSWFAEYSLLSMILWWYMYIIKSILKETSSPTGFEAASTPRMVPVVVPKFAAHLLQPRSHPIDRFKVSWSLSSGERP